MKQFKLKLMNKKKYFFLSMLLGILGASLLGDILEGKGAMAKRHGRGFIRAGFESTVKNKDF